MLFCSPSVCHVEPRLLALLMHQLLSRCVLSLRRKGTAKLATECCFFMTTPPLISTTLFRQLFDRLASLNWICRPILQILHRLITIHSQTWRNFFVRRILAPMTKQSPLLRTIWLILIQNFFVKAYIVCMTAGSVWLLVKVSTYNKYDNCLSTV